MNRQLYHPLCIRTFIILFALWLAISAPLIASAHGSEVRIELNVTQASPGATIGLPAAAPTPTANARDSLAWLLLLPVGTLVVAGTALIVKKRFARQGRTCAEHGRSRHTRGEGVPFFTPHVTA